MMFVTFCLPEKPVTARTRQANCGFNSGEARRSEVVGEIL
jgi:hypothetical protein